MYVLTIGGRCLIDVWDIMFVEEEKDNDGRQTNKKKKKKGEQ